MAKEEHVLVIPTERFHAAGYFHGFRPADPGYRAALLDPAALRFRPRSQVETDPAFKQLIPYIALKCGGQLFCYRRQGGSESRLQARWSVGIGGHVCDSDASGDGDPYTIGMWRELTEEVEIEGGWQERFLGFINDDHTPVGRVHLGVVHLLELERPAVRVKEAGLAEPGFAPVVELLARSADFESWSRLVLEELTR